MSTETVNALKEVDCPHCKGKFDVEVQQKKPKVVISEQETILNNQNTVRESQHEHIHAPDPHLEMAKNLPKGWNFATCKDGNCGTVVKNPNGLVTEFKTCPNCKDNSNKKSAKVCKTCGKKPDADEWEDSEIELELEKEEDE